MKSLNSKSIKAKKQVKLVQEALQRVFQKCIGSPAGSPIISDPVYVGQFPPIVIDFIISGPDNDSTEGENDVGGD